LTRDEALSLIEQYGDLFDLDSEDELVAHIAGMRSRFPSDGSEKKAMRWLGWVQGVLVAKGFFSLEDVKKHSREKKVQLTNTEEVKAYWKIAPEDLTLAHVEERVGGGALDWEGNCFAIACVVAELLGGRASAVYGHYTGPVDPGGYWSPAPHGFHQHGWVRLPDGRVLDPTRWSFENVEPYLYLGEADHYDEGGNDFRDLFRGPPPPWRWDPKDSKTRPVALTTVTDRSDPVYVVIARILGRDQVRFGECLVITAEQLFYVANTHYDKLAPAQPEIYYAFEQAGWLQAVPIDNQRRAQLDARAT
jgi:hypothetical protein